MVLIIDLCLFISYSNNNNTDSHLLYINWHFKPYNIYKLVQYIFYNLKKVKYF